MIVGVLGTAEEANVTAIGDTINVAARLQAEAAPGETLFGDIAAVLV